jgi:hypothetical protein
MPIVKMDGEFEIFNKVQLSRGEILWIRRRRERLTPQEAAQKLGTLPFLYTQWERGARPCPIPVGRCDVLLHEVLQLLRRRSGYTQADIAERIGCSAIWVQNQEYAKASCRPLARYWRDHAAKDTFIVVGQEGSVERDGAKEHVGLTKSRKKKLRKGHKACSKPPASVQRGKKVPAPRTANWE